METPTTNTLVSDHIIKALCNTLIHSLWQGIILALLTGAIIIFTKKVSAASRYKLLVGALALFACGVLLTFTGQMQKTTGNAIANPGNSTGVNVVGTPTAGVSAASPQNSQPIAVFAKPGVSHPQPTGTGAVTETVINYFNTHYAIIVLIWFLIICAKSIQMAVGLHSVYHLKRTRVFTVGKDWENKLLHLADQLHIKQYVRFLESGIAKVPMVIGHLKPVILIPIGLINSLTADEVEAILIHELAHIRRRDYLVNLLQSFMEIVFFFNPAVLWISQLIRTERENCCDDLAISQKCDKENYIRALVSCEEYQTGGPAYAMAFPGGKSSLLDRVKRMVGNRNHSLNSFEKTVLAICLVVLGLGISAFTGREHIKKAFKSVAAVINHEVKNLHKAEIKAANNITVKKQDITGKGTPALLSQFKHPVLSATDTGKQAGASPLKTLTGKIDSLRHGDGMPKSGLAALAKMDTATFKRFHSIGLELYRERLVTDTNHLSISLDDRELIVNGVRMPEEVFNRISRQFGKRGERGNYSGGYTETYGPSVGMDPPRIVVPDFGDTLVKYGIIKDKRHIHATLNSRGLIINGVKQPDDVFRMLFNKYGENTNITYTNNGLPDKRTDGQAYWIRQERKIIDEMQQEGLINDRKDLSFTLTGKTFVINGLVQSGEVFQRYHDEYAPADAGDNWDWNYPGTTRNYSTYGYAYSNSGAHYQSNAAERNRLDAERDKKLVADLLQDGLITDTNNVTFTLDNKGATVNGKKQSEEVYQKYKDKYLPDNNRDSSWSWTYSHHE